MIYAEIYKSHPFQSLFLIILPLKKLYKSYEIDYWGLAGKKFLESIISFEKGNKDKITIGVASWVPLHRSISMLEPNIRERILIVGQDYAKSKYIFSNNISEINKENNKKYTVPDNFIKINEFRINSRVVYEVFKKLPQ